MIEFETTIRLGVFVGAFVLFALLESVLPRRQRSFPRSQRWAANLGLVAVDTLALRLLVPLLSIGVAIEAQDQNWGLFNTVAVPTWLAVIASVIVLDFLIYLQHLATHKWSWLWRLHQCHHTDRDLDVTTAVRFHPAEICLSMFYKMFCVLALGVPPAAIILYEVMLNGAALFNHANLALPSKLDRVLRTVLVTPDMHRIHHSTIRSETDSNYGNILSIWDRLMRTYTPAPKLGQTNMELGLAEYQDTQPNRLSWVLLLPFTKQRKS